MKNIAELCYSELLLGNGLKSVVRESFIPLGLLFANKSHRDGLYPNNGF